jgi:hypothetical protein
MSKVVAELEALYIIGGNLCGEYAASGTVKFTPDIRSDANGSTSV